MKYVIICLFLIQATPLLSQVAPDGKNSSHINSRSREAKDKALYQNRSTKDKQERMEERRGWKGSSIEPAGSPQLETYDDPPKESR